MVSIDWIRLEPNVFKKNQWIFCFNSFQTHFYWFDFNCAQILIDKTYFENYFWFWFWNRNSTKNLKTKSINERVVKEGVGLRFDRKERWKTKFWFWFCICFIVKMHFNNNLKSDIGLNRRNRLIWSPTQPQPLSAISLNIKYGLWVKTSRREVRYGLSAEPTVSLDWSRSSRRRMSANRTSN